MEMERFELCTFWVASHCEEHLTMPLPIFSIFSSISVSLSVWLFVCLSVLSVDEQRAVQLNLKPKILFPFLRNAGQSNKLEIEISLINKVMTKISPRLTKLIR